MKRKQPIIDQSTEHCSLLWYERHCASFLGDSDFTNMVEIFLMKFTGQSALSIECYISCLLSV